MKLWDSLWWTKPDLFWKHAVPVLKKASFSDKDFQNIRQRFIPPGCYPQFGDWEVWCLLCFVADSIIAMELKKPYQPSSRTSKLRIPMKKWEDPDHFGLKQEATEWLMKFHNVKECYYEQSFSAGICDVVSANSKWIVECGGSRPSKVWDHFKGDRTDSSKIVFFNSVGITIFSVGPKINAYRKAHRKSWDMLAKRLKTF